MVRGNWESRIEKAEARKAIAKQLKQEKDDRANFKAMASKLINQLNEYKVASGMFHVWCDWQSSRANPRCDDTILELDEIVTKNKRLDIIKDNGGKQGPDDGRGIGRKVHPRSKVVHQQSPSSQEKCRNIPINLCKSQFFHGSCNAIGKKGNTCRSIHYSKPNRTLAETIVDSERDILHRSETAWEGSRILDTNDQNDGMSMLLYLSVQVSEFQSDNGKDERETPSLGEVLSKALVRQSYTLASIVYVVYESVLIFDRYQNGLLSIDLGMPLLIAKSLGKLNSQMALSPSKDQTIAKCIPGTVLESILLFLPDSAVGTMSRVCTAWHKEIGKSSSYIWCHLLKRHMWPIPINQDGTVQHDDVERCFKIHYETTRDVVALKDGIEAILCPRGAKPINERDLVYHDFTTKKRAPSKGSSCVSLEVWSPTEVLAAYSQDCSLRLFQATRGGADGVGKVCREIITVSVDPYKKTPKVVTELVAMTLDSKYIAVLLSIKDCSERMRYSISILSRESFLSAAGGDVSLRFSELEEGAIFVTDLTESVINFMLISDEEYIQECLDVGGDPKEIFLKASHQLVSCGNGKFLLEVSLIRPSNRPVDDNDFDIYDSDRKFLVFSASHSAIVSMTNSDPQDNIPSRCDQHLSGVQSYESASRTRCNVIAVNSHSALTTLTEISSSGQITEFSRLHDIEQAQEFMLLENNNSWEVDPPWPRRIARYPDSAIFVNVWVKHEETKIYKTVISKYVASQPYSAMVLTSCRVLNIQPMHEEHLMLLCDGDVLFRVLHIPTFEVISEISTTLDMSTRLHCQNLKFTRHSLTMCAGLGSIGIVMTGKEIRKAGQDSDKDPMNDSENKLSAKKKKKKSRLSIVNSKKDGFARGIR